MRQIDFYELSDYTTEARGVKTKIYLHWSAGFYHQAFSDYHINILGDGSLYTDIVSLCEIREHTWRRNTPSIGISLSCCYKAKPFDLGDYPPTEAQIDMMAKVVAKLCVEIGIDVNYDVMTHAEIADVDGYGLYSGDDDCRWDLYGMGGEIRRRAVEYINEWKQ